MRPTLALHCCPEVTNPNPNSDARGRLVVASDAAVGSTPLMDMDMGSPGQHASLAHTAPPAPPHTFTYPPAVVGHFLQHAAAQV